MEDKAKKYRVLLNQYLASVNVAMSNLYSDAEFKLITAVSSFPIEQLEKGFPAALKKQISEIIKKLNAKSGKIITAGAQASWALSNKKNDEFVKGYFKGKPKPKGWQEKYCQTNTDALKSFLDRKTNGMNLSERVWDYNEEYKEELENALQIGIGNGVSAKSMSKFLTKFLKNPSATVIEVDEDGEAKKIKNPAAAKPGRGVYRDPKQNAMRLARTEINMAYDTADWTRYQQLDFVVGFEVHLSGNHTVKRGGKFVKLVDICDRLAGKYPKSFKFSGWHPQCRCYVTSILKTQEEQDAEDLAKLRGEAVEDKPSKNTVTEPPQGFKDWVKENSGRLEKSKSLPYFVRDNKEYFEDVEFPKSVEKQFKEAEKPLTKEQRRELTLQKAEERHAARTPEQVKDIKERWEGHKARIETIKRGNDTLNFLTDIAHTDNLIPDGLIDKGNEIISGGNASAIDSFVNLVHNTVNKIFDKVDNAFDLMKKNGIKTVVEINKEVNDNINNARKLKGENRVYACQENFDSAIDNINEGNQLYRYTKKAYGKEIQTAKRLIAKAEFEMLASKITNKKTRTDFEKKFAELFKNEASFGELSRINIDVNNYLVNTQNEPEFINQWQVEKAIKKNNKELGDELGIKVGRRKTEKETNQKAVNPNFLKGWKYQNNCYKVAPTAGLYMRGLAVEALPHTTHPSWNTAWDDGSRCDNGSIYIDPKTNKTAVMNSITDNKYGDFISKVKTELTTPGLYMCFVIWSKNAGAHVFNVSVRSNGDIIYNDRQDGRTPDFFNETLKSIRRRPYCLYYLKIDNLLLKKNILKDICQAK